MSAAELLAALQVIFAGAIQSAVAVVPVFVTLFVASFLDLLSGAWAAKMSGTFDSKFLPAWIESHADKIVKISLILIAAVSVGGIDNVVGLGLVALGTTEAGLYLAAVVGSIRGNVADGRDGTKGAPSFGGKGADINVLNVSSNDAIDETDLAPARG